MSKVVRGAPLPACMRYSARQSKAPAHTLPACVQDLRDKVALITGASTGIGAGAARALSKAGMIGKCGAALYAAAWCLHAWCLAQPAGCLQCQALEEPAAAWPTARHSSICKEGAC